VRRSRRRLTAPDILRHRSRCRAGVLRSGFRRPARSPATDVLARRAKHRTARRAAPPSPGPAGSHASHSWPSRIRAGYRSSVPSRVETGRPTFGRRRPGLGKETRTGRGKVRAHPRPRLHRGRRPFPSSGLRVSLANSPLRGRRPLRPEAFRTGFVHGGSPGRKGTAGRPWERRRSTEGSRAVCHRDRWSPGSGWRSRPEAPAGRADPGSGGSTRRRRRKHS
jgi:hypothetical protein